MDINKRRANSKIDRRQALCVFSLVLTLAACSSGSDDGNDENLPDDMVETPADTPQANPSDGSMSGDNDEPTQNPLPMDEAFSDEFSVDSLSRWTLRHQEEGEDAQYTLLDINQTNAGRLTIQPTLTPGWFAGGKAPLIFKMVTGNFTVETSVTTASAENPGLPPGGDYNSAGLMVRTTTGTGENHIMVNAGRQTDTIDFSLGSEAKNTTNSSSVLDLQTGSHNGDVTLCRVGNEITVYRRLDNETGWSQIGRAIRDDFPETVQVGMIVNGYSGPADSQLRMFDPCLSS